MAYLNFVSQYDKYPTIEIKGHDDAIAVGTTDIIRRLKDVGRGVLCFECYPGVDLPRLEQELILPLHPKRVINIENYAKSAETIDRMLKDNLTDDRVFGYMSDHVIEDFYLQDTLTDLKKELEKTDDFVVIYGFGASLIKSDVLCHVGLTRWEIHLRYRKGMPNFKTSNEDEDVLRKYKRGYFVEWRVADRIKDVLYDKLDFVIDWTHLDKPAMITAVAYKDALDQIVKRPFRMMPYFDPGVWGGQWMKEVCDLDREQPNFAWSFDGVPEENSIRLAFNDKTIDLPAQDLVQFHPVSFMGKRVYERFDRHFPIRFDMLDTMHGENLSLQVHPMDAYIKKTFGMTYTQHESYYILAAEEDGSVFLGFKDNIDEEAFRQDLLDAEKGEKPFEAETYVNRFPAKKHDHFSIPAGTIHCSGKNTMVLEVSACVYIFTFKLWDWGRLGLDQRPRPVHLEHGFNSLQYDRTTDWVERELINPIRRVSDHEEITGLHELEFLETRRYTFNKPLWIPLDGSIHVANLVEGEAAIITASDGAFAAFEVHYAETFLLPAQLESFTIRPKDPGRTCMIIKASVR
jgi:mannose-6-phosphate isomerase class I